MTDYPTVVERLKARCIRHEDTIILLRAERDTLKRENALLRSGIDPDSEYLDGLALGMNIAFIGEKVGAQLDEVPVC